MCAILESNPSPLRYFYLNGLYRFRYDYITKYISSAAKTTKGLKPRSFSNIESTRLVFIESLHSPFSNESLLSVNNRRAGKLKW